MIGFEPRQYINCKFAIRSCTIQPAPHIKSEHITLLCKHYHFLIACEILLFFYQQFVSPTLFKTVAYLHGTHILTLPLSLSFGLAIRQSKTKRQNNTNNYVPLPSLSGGSVAEPSAVTATTNLKKS